MSMATIRSEQQQAIDAPFEASLAITGAAGTGKTFALGARIERFRSAHPALGYLHVFHPDELAPLAFEVLREGGMGVSRMDDTAAESELSNAAQSLFALEWEEIVAGSMDPEIGGLRSPKRFLSAAYRLIRKLRDAAISPAEFLDLALSGATRFYANPPNLAHPNLIHATKDAYRDSLEAEPAELARQYRREVDLAKVLARLYTAYDERTRASGRLTSRDAIAAAIVVMRGDSAIAERLRARYRCLFLDEAQAGTFAMRLLLEAIYGSALHGVTFAGDPNGATNTFRGARPDAMFRGFERRIELHESHRTSTPAVSLYRAADESFEARYVADAVAERRRSGLAPSQIAVLFRSVADVARYEEALLECGVPAAVVGDANLFLDRRVLDALAVLWNIWDPFAHDWMIRTLRGRALRLSDAAIAALCAEPAHPQAPLFILGDEQAPTERSRRWDPKRDLRLGWNVLHGEQDGALDPEARTRIERFRERRSLWLQAMDGMSLVAFVRFVWADALAREGESGTAAEAAQQLVLRRFLERAQAFESETPGASLGDFLQYVQLRAESPFESLPPVDDDRFVQIASVEACRGRAFEFVVIPDARAGSFPRWYVPDAFLFSPKLGMIAKDNVGDARASRTAKFSYYLAKSKAREAYNDEERRAFFYAMRRAKSAVLVTASGRATRGTTAPEFLEELRRR